jgi:KTSC domain
MPSSVIAAMSYNDETRTLTIVYRGKRGVYRYFDVPPEEFAAFRSAPSKGTYLNEIFKTRQYRYERRPNH